MADLTYMIGSFAILKGHPSKIATLAKRVDEWMSKAGYGGSVHFMSKSAKESTLHITVDCSQIVFETWLISEGAAAPS